MTRTHFRPRRPGATERQAIVDGVPLSHGPVGRLRLRLQSALVSAAERKEVLFERRLLEIAAPTRPKTIVIASPTGGVGATTVSFLLGNLLASRLGLRVVAVDPGPEPGTLAKLARRGHRGDRSLADLVRDAGRLRSASELRMYATSLPTGLHVLAADRRLSGLTAAGHERLVDLLTRFYDIVILDFPAAGTRGLLRFALERADQLVLVSNPQWIAARSVLDAIPSLPHERATLVLNKARPPRDAGQSAIVRRLGDETPDAALLIPYDRRLAAMLDSGTYTLEALARPTRVAVKRLGLAVAEQFV